MYYHPHCGFSRFCTAPDDLKTLCYTAHGIFKGHVFVEAGCLNITLNPHWQRLCNNSIGHNAWLQCCDSNNCNTNWFFEGIPAAEEISHSATPPMTDIISSSSSAQLPSLFTTVLPMSTPMGFDGQGMDGSTMAMTVISLSRSLAGLSSTPSPTSSPMGLDSQGMDYSALATTSSAGLSSTPSPTPTSIPSDGSTLLYGLIAMGVLLPLLLITGIIVVCRYHRQVKHWIQRRSIEDRDMQLLSDMEPAETAFH